MSGNSYYFRKIHSLLGVIPVGLFLLEHLLTNYSAFTGGNKAFTSKVLWLNHLPFIFYLELFGIWLPLLYHGVYGLYVAFQARNNASSYGYFRNRMFVLQRVTGVITFIFILWHTFETRFQVTLGNVTHEDLGMRMHQILSNHIYFALYCIGIVAAVFHFCNGMWSFLVSWGITIGPRAQKVSTYVFMIAFVLISLVGILALTGFVRPDFTAALSSGMTN